MLDREFDHRKEHQKLEVRCAKHDFAMVNKMLDPRGIGWTLTGLNATGSMSGQVIAELH
jgi:hypothetical protein